MEYTLSSAVKKLAVTDKPTIGFIQGHGEPALEELMQLRAELEVMYNLEPYHIAGGTVPGPNRYAAMVWLRPTDSIPQHHFEFIDQYIANGGHMMVAYNPMEGDFVNMVATEKYTGMTQWLATKGLSVERNLVIDNRCGSVSVQQNQGMFAFASNVSFPYLPLLIGQEKNDISGGLESVMFEFPSEIVYQGDTTIQYEPVLMTSRQSNGLKAPQVLNVQQEWTPEDFVRSNIVVGASLSGMITGNSFSRFILYTDGDFPVNGPRDQARQVQPDNINLFANSVDWLLDETGLIALRTRGAVARPLEPLEDNTKTLLKYANFLAPILLVFIYGLIRGQRRRAIRKRRMQADYSTSQH